VHLALADLYHWTPEQVEALDPDYVDHLIARQNAQADHHKAESAAEQRKREREKRLAEARKRMGR
jgi:hypothetical protein